MTSIIKNQIIKHLSKFARNLKPEQISLDVLKGKSKLQFIELNEDILTEVLELPSWLRIKRAFCAGVTVSVPWTKLKSAPVQIFIDEINVEVVLTTDPPIRQENLINAFTDGSSYGYADKVVEGMSLYINTVEITFDSDVFGGSLMLSRLSVESRTPAWQPAQDLRQTRINCAAINRTLMYKQVSWQLLRIEASAKTDKNEKRCTINAPLRLITSGGKIKIALKKNSIDGSVIHAQIHMILEDILWVATLAQLRSAIAFYSHIMSLVKQSQTGISSTIIVPPKLSNLSPEDRHGILSDTFRAFDFDQTSYHLHIKKIDLHLCDDANSSISYPPNWDIDSGAMQVTLHQVLIDIYPKTLASSNRTHWPRYTSPNAIMQWIALRLKQQLKSLSAEIDDTGRIRLARCWPQLMSFNVVVRIFDAVIQCVSDMNSKKDSLQNLFSSDRHIRSLPNDQFIIHFEFATFVHPMSNSLPVPSPATFLQLGPFSVLFDRRTLRWCLYVIHSITTAFQQSNSEVEAMSHSDIRIDLLMPKVILSLPKSLNDDHNLPHRLVISLSTLSVSNCPFEMLPDFDLINDATISYVKNLNLFGGGPSFIKDLMQLKSESFKNDEGEKFWLRTSPAWVDTDHGPIAKPIPVISDVSFMGAFNVQKNQINGFIEPISEVFAVIDHFQFLQLSRLSSSLSQFFDLLAADQKHFLNEGKFAPITMVLLVSIKKIRANIFLTMGAIQSPYDRCPRPIDSNIAESLSEFSISAHNNASRRLLSSGHLVSESVKKTQVVDGFPEFKTGPDIDSNSFVDDSMSIATSMEDESNFEFDIVQDEDDLYPADIAEEAYTVDDEIFNDRIYKNSMAKHGNVLIIELGNVLTAVNVHNNNTHILGKADSIVVLNELNISRSKVYDEIKLRKMNTTTVSEIVDPQAQFTVDVFSHLRTSFVKLTITKMKAELDDEIVSHLSAFLLDDEVTENRVRLAINIVDSNIEIHDRKKKKPVRIRLRDCIIEQDEDELLHSN